MTTIYVSITKCCSLFILLFTYGTLLQSVNAGCGSYDRETETCCRGKVYKVANQSCCDTLVYNPETQTCCKNILHPGGNLSCCNIYAFDASEHTCCNGSLFVGGGQLCENATQQCDAGQTVVVACYKYCTCNEALAGAVIPDHCGQVCEDCMGAKGELVGCAPKCECDANNGYVRQKNRSSKCVKWQTCRQQKKDPVSNQNKPTKKGSSQNATTVSSVSTTLPPRTTKSATKYKTSYYSKILQNNATTSQLNVSKSG